jgi:hypothetical protein
VIRKSGPALGRADADRRRGHGRHRLDGDGQPTDGRRHEKGGAEAREDRRRREAADRDRGEEQRSKRPEVTGRAADLRHPAPWLARHSPPTLFHAGKLPACASATKHAVGTAFGHVSSGLDTE